jgi:hypothetical protein
MVIGWWTTQREEGDGGPKRWRTQHGWRTTRQEEGSRGSNAAADDTTINYGKVTILKVAYNVAVACISLAMFAKPCSVIGWLLHCALLLLLFDSVRHLLLPCYICHSPLCCLLVVVMRAAAPSLNFCCCLLLLCSLC